MENTPPEKRRRRPPLACIACRRRKVRCDRKLPCQNCVRARRAASCSYVSDERIEPREGTEGFADGINGRHPQRDALSSVPFFTTTASPSSSSPDQLAERVKQLEEQLGKFVNARNGSTSAQSEVPKAYFNNANLNPPTASTFLGPEHWQVQGSGIADTSSPRARYSREAQGSNRERGDPNTDENHSASANVNAILSKSRYLGNSHWIHGVTLVSPIHLNCAHRLPLAQGSSASCALDRPTLVSIRFRTMPHNVSHAPVVPCTGSQIRQLLPCMKTYLSQSKPPVPCTAPAL